MKTALVCAGGVGQSFLARMPGLMRSVGPLKAASLRVGRRIANSLRAGSAVEAYSALDDADLILIAVPDVLLERIVGEVASEVAIGGRMIVLCATQRDSLWPGPLINRGASVATLDAIEPDEHILVAEGHAGLLKVLHRIAVAEGRKLIRIQPGSKTRYLASVRLASDLPLPFFAAAVESLRAAGFSRSEAARVVEALGARSLHAYGKSGRKAWSRANGSNLRESLNRDLDFIRPVDAPLAELYRQGVEQALRYFED